MRAAGQSIPADTLAGPGHRGAGERADAASRAQTYARLIRRNTVVGVLRFAVPALGAIVLGVLLAYIFITNMAEHYAIGGLSLERGAVVIKAPSYQGVLAGGATYAVTAAQATASVTGGDTVLLQDAQLVFARPDGYELNAHAAEAVYDLMAQTITVAADLQVTDSYASTAVLQQTLIDWTDRTLVAGGGATVTYANGTVLHGAHLTYTIDTASWVFDQVRVQTSLEAGAGQ